MSEEYAAVFSADSRRPVVEAALVLTAMSIDNHISREDHIWHLWVAKADQARAHHQLQAYWHENQPAAEQPVEATVIDSGWAGVAGFLLIIWLLPGLQNYTDGNLLAAGRLHAAAVVDGEWWRAVTALTLHADMAHIASNSLFGCVFGLFVGRYLGSGVGWLLVLICGTVANLLNAFIQPGAFRAIGASTATFACLGLVPAFGWRRGFFRGRGWVRGFAPLFAAIALLAFTGFGSERVDVLGHLFGFAAGISMGLACAHMNLSRISVADQQRAGGFAVLLVATAWFFASGDL